jgi:hypothetical protein
MQKTEHITKELKYVTPQRVYWQIIQLVKDVNAFVEFFIISEEGRREELPFTHTEEHNMSATLTN